jgi:hypothetical protein
VEPGRRLTFHWWAAPDGVDGAARTPAEAGASTVEIDLEVVEGGTLVRVTETAPPGTELMASAAPGLLAPALV